MVLDVYQRRDFSSTALWYRDRRQGYYRLDSAITFNDTSVKFLIFQSHIKKVKLAWDIILNFFFSFCHKHRWYLEHQGFEILPDASIDSNLQDVQDINIKHNVQEIKSIEIDDEKLKSVETTKKIQDANEITNGNIISKLIKLLRYRTSLIIKHFFDFFIILTIFHLW